MKRGTRMAASSSWTQCDVEQSHDVAVAWHEPRLLTVLQQHGTKPACMLTVLQQPGSNLACSLYYNSLARTSPAHCVTEAWLEPRLLTVLQQPGTNLACSSQHCNYIHVVSLKIVFMHGNSSCEIWIPAWNTAVCMKNNALLGWPESHISVDHWPRTLLGKYSSLFYNVLLLYMYMCNTLL